MLRLVPQIRENSHAALVGISSTFVSLGSPSLAPTMGWIAIAEGKGLKMSETAANEPDITLQHRSLSVGPRNTRSPSLSRSRSMVRNRTGHSLKARNRYDLDPEPAHSAPETEYKAPLSARDNTNQRRGMDGGHYSHPNTPLQHSCEAAAPFSAYSAPPRDIEGFEQLSAGVIGHHPRCLVVESRSTTPAERLSTESCHTVAVMESMGSTNRANANAEHPGGILNASARGNADTDDSTVGIDEDDMQSHRSYLTKATKQFQRNAKAFDRKLGRSFDDTLRMRSRSHILPPKSYGDPCGEIGGASNTQHTLIQADLSDMGIYMEKERRKLERRSSYFGSEIRFMTALMDISRRVCAVAKAGRQQFLKAELTLLNHSLDKHTCIPLWCPESGGQHHHRIVRIPTEDTVVLNSAERAPYLLTLEVLDPDGSASLEDPCAGLSAGDAVASAREVDSEHAGKWTSAPTHRQPNVAPAAVETIGNGSAIAGDSDTEGVTELNNAQSTIAA
ncbi:hypothetical protein GGI22_003917, partial [Coemansia erecta]